MHESKSQVELLSKFNEVVAFGFRNGPHIHTQKNVINVSFLKKWFMKKREKCYKP